MYRYGKLFYKNKYFKLLYFKRINNKTPVLLIIFFFNLFNLCTLSFRNIYMPSIYLFLSIFSQYLQRIYYNIKVLIICNYNFNDNVWLFIQGSYFSKFITTRVYIFIMPPLTSSFTHHAVLNKPI